MLTNLPFLISLPLLELLTAFLAKSLPRIHKLVLIAIVALGLFVSINLPISQLIYSINLGFFELKFMCDIYSYFFGILVIVIWLLTNLYAYSYSRIVISRNKLITFFRRLSLAIFAVLGGCYAANLWTLFIFYVLLILFTASLILQNPNKTSLKAYKIYLATHLGTSFLLLLPAITILQFLVGSTDFVGFNNSILLADHHLAALLLLLFVFGIAKNCIFPFGSWIVKSTVAPNPVNGLLHSVAAVKSGSVAMIKIVVYIFGLNLTKELTSNFFTGGWIFYLCGFTATYAAYRALKTTNIKKRFAYSTISQLSYILSSVMIAIPMAIMAAVLHIISHSLCKVVLFYIAGIFSSVYKTGNTKDIAAIAPKMKFWIAILAFCGASIIGMPFLPGSYGKDYMILSELETNNYSSLIFLITGSFINILYIYPIVKAAFFNKTISNVKTRVIPLTMRLAILIGTTLAIIMGLFVSDMIKFFEFYQNWKIN